MKENVMVKIPGGANYTLYAEGVLLGMEFYGADYIVSLDFSYPVVLYYTFHYHRRLYIIMRASGRDVYRCHDVSSPFSIISQLRGRSFDRFKRSLAYIVKKTSGFHQFPPEFYFKLSFICSQGKNDMVNLNRLIEKYYTCRQALNPGTIDNAF